MAKPRLKVYRTQMGFAEAIVAAPNQKAALDAWGARQNLFAEGLADVATEAGTVEAAIAKPGVVLQRAVGSTAAFQEQLGKGPAVPEAKPKSRAKPKSASYRSKIKPPPDRTAVSAAEKRLLDIDSREQAALGELSTRRDELDGQEAEIGKVAAKDRQAAQKALVGARAAYKAAGGRE